MVKVKERKRAREGIARTTLGIAVLVACVFALGGGTAAAADHWYCPTIAAQTACSSGIQHTYAKNNVAYDGASLAWCEGLVTPGGGWYSQLCTPPGYGNGFTLYGTWRDWCGYPVGCVWVANGSTSLYDIADNRGSNAHTFRAHSYW